MSWLDRLRIKLWERAGDEESRDPELARLLERARGLPRSKEPQRDLFLGIENRIAGRATVPEPGLGLLTTLFPRPLAALSVGAVLVATTALSVLWFVQPCFGSLNK